MESTKAALRKFIEDSFIMGRGTPLADDDSFMDLHVLDSTGFLEVIAHLEETYGIVVSDEEMVPENLDSLANLATFVVRKRHAHSLAC